MPQTMVIYMLKNRLIPCVILQNDLVVQSFNFKNYLPIGKIDAVIEFLVNWDVDEIIVIDITATPENRSISLDIIDRVAKKCFVPLTVGGGVKDIETVRKLLRVGADKVVFNSLIHENPSFISEMATKYGSQFVTASIDAKKDGDKHFAYTYGGNKSLDISVEELAKKVEDLGAGEIFLNSIDRDGSREGYDLDLLSKVSSAVKIPVIACGGVGRAGHLAMAITEGGCQAASAANIFNHTEMSTVAGKAIMKKNGLPIRIDSQVQYSNIEFDFLDRPI